LLQHYIQSSVRQEQGYEFYVFEDFEILAALLLDFFADFEILGVFQRTALFFNPKKLDNFWLFSVGKAGPRKCILYLYSLRAAY